MKRKRILSIFLIICFIMQIIPFNTIGLEKANAAVTLSSDGYYSYIIHDDGSNCTLTNISSAGMESGTFRQIPSSVDGYTVTALGDGTTCIYGTSMALNGCKGQVIIPSTVTRVEAYAFYYLYTSYIYMPDSVTYIGDYAFSQSMLNSSNSSHGRMSQNVTYVGTKAFYNSKIDVSTLDFTKLEGCGPYAFNYCYSNDAGVVNLSSFQGIVPEGAFASNTNGFTKFILGVGVTGIGDSVFKYDTSLTTIIFSDSLVTIGEDSFNHCTSLTTINCPSSLKSIGSNAFYYCSALRSLTLNAGLEYIRENAFYSAPLQAKIVIPKSVTLIELAAFSSCSNIRQIYMYNPTCDIKGDYTTLLGYSKDKTTLYGYSGSTTEDYATSNSFAFVSLDDSVDSITAVYNGVSVIQGQEFDKKDIVITANWVEANGTTTIELPGTNCEITYSDTIINNVGNNNITVTYNGQSATLNIIGLSATPSEVVGELQITSQSCDKTGIAGYSTELFVNAKASFSTKELTYQWYRNNVKIDGEISNVIQLLDIDTGLTGSYTCKVIEDSSYIFSVPISVSIIDNPLQADLDSVKSTITTLQGKVADLQEQLEEVDNELQTAKDNITSLNGMNEDLTNQLEIANSTITTLENDKVELQVQLDDANHDLSSAFDKIKALQESATEDAETISNLNNTIIDLQNNISTIENDISNLNGNVATLSSLLNSIKAELGVETDDEILNAIKNLKIDIETKTTENKTLKDNITILEDKLNAEISNNNSLNNLLDTLRATADVTTNDELTSKINDILSELEISNQTIQTLTDKNNTLVTQINDLVSRNTELTNRVAELEDLLASKDSDLQQQVDELTEDVTNLTNDKKNLEDSVLKLNADINKLSDTNKDLQSQIDKLQSLLDSANLTIDELRTQLSDSYAENQSIKIENESLKSQVDTLTKQMADKSATSVASPTITAEPISETDVILKVPETISNIVTGPTSTTDGATVTALDGWELSSNVNGSTWSDSLVVSDSATTGIYTFFTNSSEYIGEASSKVNSMMTNALHTVNSKHLFYARKKINVAVVYVCSYDFVDGTNNCNQINTSITCNNPKIVLNYNEANTYDVSIAGKLVFQLSAGFGKYDRGGIYYQVVNQNIDFDPNGSWIEVKNDKIILSDITKACRLYIKYIDSKGNFVVDKTVGFKPKDTTSKLETKTKTEEITKEISVPTFEMNKTIYKGYSFNLNLANVTQDMKINYKSSNPKVAKVNKNGIISSVNNGKAKIMGTMTNKTKVYRFIINVTVSDGNGQKTLYQKPVKSVSVMNNPVLIAYKLIQKGKKSTLKLSNLNRDSKVSYLNSNDEVVSVTKKGVVKGLKKGHSVITIKVEQENQTYVYIVQVRVTDGTTDLSMWNYLQEN